MRCHTALSYLNAYIDNELSEKRSLSVRRHLAACEACQRRFADIQGIDALFRGTLSVPAVPDGLAVRIMALARRRQAKADIKEPVWQPLRWLAGLSAPMRIAVCASVFIAFITGFSLNGGGITGRGMSREVGNNLSGLEWFAPTPPASIASIYIALEAGETEGNRL